MTEATDKMIEAGCRERCRQEGRIADYMVHYVGIGEHRYACDPIPQAETMPLWRWKFYESFKEELEAALAARADDAIDKYIRALSDTTSPAVDAVEFAREIRGYIQSTCVCPLDKAADVIEAQAAEIARLRAKL